ncbi:MAG: NAD(P)-dependent oxidoreductase [Verrucomicrobiota bacterium]
MKILITGGSGFIGTNVIERFSGQDIGILNYSLHAPLNSEQTQYWRQGDILDPQATTTVFREFQPTHVLHLAARAECDEDTTVEEGYRANTEGTQNVLDAIRATPSIERTIITSTQFVCGPGRLPVNDTDYFPETVYGQSKVITEELTRAAGLTSCWTIVRPTNVWGPWHMRYRREFWRVLERGFYVHPGRRPVIRAYAYVGNVAGQIQKIFEAQPDLVDGKTLYVGDRSINLFEWVNGFSLALTGREVRVIPRGLMRSLALTGDIPTRMTGKPFLINSSRYRSMITNYETPMEPTFDLLGENPYTLEDGIRETVKWLRSCREFSDHGGGS